MSGRKKKTRNAPSLARISGAESGAECCALSGLERSGGHSLAASFFPRLFFRLLLTTYIHSFSAAAKSPLPALRLRLRPFARAWKRHDKLSFALGEEKKILWRGKKTSPFPLGPVQKFFFSSSLRWGRMLIILVWIKHAFRSPERFIASICPPLLARSSFALDEEIRERFELVFPNALKTQ